MLCVLNIAAEAAVVALSKISISRASKTAGRAESLIVAAKLAMRELLRALRV